jgi:pilus retraction protein PilT
VLKFHSLIQAGVKEGYSDIHISGDHPIVCRKHGKILFLNESYTCEQIDGLVTTLLEKHELKMLKERLSVDFARSVAHIRIRVNVFLTTRGLSLAVRLLPGRIPNFSDLNLLPELKEYCGLSSGLILICGATGSGKSTTIAAFLSEINRNFNCHIITLEDPVEYRFNSGKSYIEQRELGTHINSFDQGLQDVLREDPDVIMVGELRDPETIKLTLNAVESGHLVIASLHATNSEDALYRMCNSFPPDAQDMVRTQLSSVLSLLIVQKLEFLPRFGFRVPILSILKGTNSVKSTIRDNRFAQIESILQTGRGDGMYTQAKYESEYINTKNRLTPPEISFKPSTEIANSRVYSSPVVDRNGDMGSREIPSSPRKTQPEPVAPTRNELGHYIIHDTSSVEDVISQLGRK